MSPTPRANPATARRRPPAVLLLLLPLAACGSDPGLVLASAQVSVSGRAVETQSGGSGAGPVVVFEAGEGDALAVWQKAAPLVAARHKVFLYSRAGYGKSAASSAPRDGATLVGELRALLAAAAVPTPILLVAHSDAGLYAELYAKTQPSEIAGLVLVDPRHRDFTAQCTAAGYPDCVILPALVDGLPQPFQAEYRALQQTIDEVKAAPPGFGSLPLRVISGTGIRNEDRNWLKLWLALHVQLAAESTQGVRDTAATAGHYVQIDQPDAVAAAVDEVAALLK